MPPVIRNQGGRVALTADLASNGAHPAREVVVYDPLRVFRVHQTRAPAMNLLSPNESIPVVKVHNV